MGVINGDTRSSDYGSYAGKEVLAQHTVKHKTLNTLEYSEGHDCQVPGLREL